MLRNRSPQPRQSAAAFVLATVAAAWLAVSLWTVSLYREYRETQLRGQTAALSASSAGSLSNMLNQRLALVRGLAAFVTVKAADPVELESEFPAFAEASHQSVEGIRNLSVAPDFIVRQVYPADPGNLRVLGNDLLADRRPGYSEAVRRAIQTRSIAAHDPVRMIQGEFGVIARQAIYLGDRVWGAVGIAFTLDPVINGSGLPRLEDIDWAVRSNAGTLVGGDPTVFDARPETARIELPDGYWELAMVPRDGWDAAAGRGLEPLLLQVMLAAFGALLLWVVYDQQRRRQRLTELVEARTAEIAAVNIELERMAHAVAHDLQEPLRSISGFSQLVNRRFADRLDEDGRTWLAQLVVAAGRMKEVLSDVQIYLAEGQVPLPLAPVAAARPLAAACERLSGAIAETSAVLETGDLPLVMADSKRLADIFYVLLSNAVKYRDKSRPLRVSIGKAAPVDGQVGIEVRDNGIGIEADYLSRVFQPFQRLHGPEQPSGTGMGLAIARKMAGRMGGRLAVRSQPGEGSVFTIYLTPAADEQRK